MNIHVAGENSLVVYFADKPSESVSNKIQNLMSNLLPQMGGFLIDLVPSYASVLVIFNPLVTDHLHVRKAIRSAVDTPAINLQQADSAVVTLPVYYSAESGPDLEQLAKNAQLTPEQVIEIHQASEYRVYAIGFAPGFAYLGEVDHRIAAPRLSTPRQKVPKGAVAIADRQTAVYPSQSPGGWNLIGLCPTDMFDPNSTPSMPVRVGDRVKFEAISREQFIHLGGNL